MYFLCGRVTTRGEFISWTGETFCSSRRHLKICRPESAVTRPATVRRCITPAKHYVVWRSADRVCTRNVYRWRHSYSKLSVNTSYQPVAALGQSITGAGNARLLHNQRIKPIKERQNNNSFEQLSSWWGNNLPVGIKICLIATTIKHC